MNAEDAVPLLPVEDAGATLTIGDADVASNDAAGRSSVRYRAGRRQEATVYRTGVWNIDSLRWAVRRARRHDLDVTVTGRGSLLPAAVAAAGGVSVDRVVVDDDPRRRLAILARSGDGAPIVVKVGRRPGAPGRAEAEQAALTAVTDAGLGAVVPTPLGHGVILDREWAAESFVGGVPVRVAGRAWRLRRGHAVLDAVGGWLTELAVATRQPPVAGTRLADAVPLDSAVHSELRDVELPVAEIPTVLAHGDLASGHNLLVKGRQFAVIDWETAMHEAPPLLDLLPTLATAAARIDGVAGVHDRVEYVLALCEGRARRSPWLFAHVERHLRRLEVPLEAVGPLALLSWGYHASMRARRDELVRHGGHEPRPWTSPFEIVFARWRDERALGSTWRAFTEGVETRRA
jgi:hypothetical protein